MEDFGWYRFRKHKAGQAVPRRQLTPGMLREIRDLAAGWGQIVAKRAFGASGPGLDVDFDMMEQIAQAAALGLTDEAQPPENQAEGPPARDPEQDPWAPRKRLRTCVATLANSRAFGRLVAAEAKERDFYRATRKAFVADGAAYNWKLRQRYFSGFVPIADFLHVLCYVYRAARAVAADEAKRWDQYVGWLRACWQGRVAEVIEQLRDWQGQIGLPPPQEELPASDPRRAVAEALSYFSHNEGRMKYPEYRRAGLPVTSSLVESLVGEVNARVKSKQKYWNRGAGAEAILQLRAAVLSEDGRLDRHFKERPGSPYRRRQKQGDHTAPAKVATEQCC